MKTLKRKDVRKAINATRGRLFSVEFIKRTTGEKRKMVARTGVYKYVLGQGLSFVPSEKGLVSVFDMHKNAYRFINIEGLVKIKLFGTKYKVV